MKMIKLGDENRYVRRWQIFLRGQELFTEVFTGEFDQETFQSTVRFQKDHELKPDGIVGNKTIGAAMVLGFDVIETEVSKIESPNWPAPPDFDPIVSNSERQKLFGKFAYKPKPTADNPEGIQITDNWDKENIVEVQIEQLKKIKGSARVYFHKLAAEQLKSLWADWEKEELLYLVKTWQGSYNPRFIRGSDSILSNHSFGSAFDINYEWNRLGVVPALVGDKGCVRELVKIANQNGFYWGGHFSRQDGMHFEIAELL